MMGRNTHIKEGMCFLAKERLCFSAINDGLYGISLIGRDLHLTLLRSPAYSSHPKNNETIITPRDRYQPPMDQGEHQFRLWFNQGECTERIEQLPREAQLLMRNLSTCRITLEVVMVRLPHCLLSPTIQLNLLH
jgi:hypothetical protein